MLQRSSNDIAILLKERTNSIGDCWVWQGSTGSHGYGDIRLDNKHYLAHRLMYQIFYGIDPTGFHIMHTCDNRRCINPEHLRIGDRADNISDYFRKQGRRGNVRKHARYGWDASICIKGTYKKKHFKTEELAKAWLESIKEQYDK